MTIKKGSHELLLAYFYFATGGGVGEELTNQHTKKRLKRERMLTLSSHASSRMSSASEEIVLFLSCNWVTSNSIPQLLKNSTFALSNTRKCFVAYNLQLCKSKKNAFLNGRKIANVVNDLSL